MMSGKEAVTDGVPSDTVTPGGRRPAGGPGPPPGPPPPLPHVTNISRSSGGLQHALAAPVYLGFPGDYAPIIPQTPSRRSPGPSCQ